MSRPAEDEEEVDYENDIDVDALSALNVSDDESSDEPDDESNDEPDDELAHALRISWEEHVASMDPPLSRDNETTISADCEHEHGHLDNNDDVEERKDEIQPTDQHVNALIVDAQRQVDALFRRHPQSLHIPLDAIRMHNNRASSDNRVASSITAGNGNSTRNLGQKLQQQHRMARPQFQTLENAASIVIPASAIMCGICWSIPEGTLVSYKCGHFWCDTCDGRVNACPFCRACKEPHSGPENVALTRLIRSHVPCVCTYAPDCTWNGMLNDYKTHALVCQFATRACPWCAMHFTSSVLDHHSMNECDHRPVKCAHCKLHVSAHALAFHQTHGCTRPPVADKQCDRCDAKFMTLSEVTKHMQHCLHITDMCRWCRNVTLPRVELIKHELSCLSRQLECPQKCGQFVKLPDIARHISQVCPKRTISCSWCEIVFPADMCHEHRLHSCLKRPIVCDDCQRSIPLDQWVEHSMQQCDQAVRDCGRCHQKFSLVLLASHQRNCDGRSRCSRCPAIVNVDDQTTHDFVCPEATFDCLCGVRDITVKHQHLHFIECPQRARRCTDCHEVINKFRAHWHKNMLCPRRPIPCLGCHRMFPRQLLAQHVAHNPDCRTRVVVCGLAGCFDTIPYQRPAPPAPIVEASPPAIQPVDSTSSTSTISSSTVSSSSSSRSRRRLRTAETVTREIMHADRSASVLLTNSSSSSSSSSTAAAAVVGSKVEQSVQELIQEARCRHVQECTTQHNSREAQWNRMPAFLVRQVQAMLRTQVTPDLAD